VAAKRFFRKLLNGLRYVPRVLVTDKLASYQVAHRELLPSVTHRRSKYLNRAENSHRPTRVPRTGDETLRLTWAGPTVHVCVQPHPCATRILK
jgi:transposase-like protein